MKIILDSPYKSFFWWGICHLVEHAMAHPSKASGGYIREALQEIPGKGARRRVATEVCRKIAREKEHKAKVAAMVAAMKGGAK